MTMCRLLAIRSETPFSMRGHLEQFREVARSSPQYQGHGWGCAWKEGDAWRLYKSILPIWEDDFSPFGDTTLLLAHARSAFRDENIRVEFNMPFMDEPYVFLFNGELHGVRIREQGINGADKVFRVIRRFENGCPGEALRKGSELIRRNSAYVKGMNIILSDGTRFYVHSRFSEQDDYFTLRLKRERERVILCSREYPDDTHGWNRLANGATVEV